MSFRSNPPFSTSMNWHTGASIRKMTRPGGNLSPSEQFFQAIQEKNVDKIKKLLESVNIIDMGSDEDGNSVLLAAIKSGDVELMEMIAKALPQENILQLLEQFNEAFELPLHTATRSPKIFIALLRQLEFLPADRRTDLLLKINRWSENIFFAASNSLELMTALFKFVPEDQHAALALHTSGSRSTLLHHSLDNKSHGVARMLIAAVPPSQLATMALNQDKINNTLFFTAIQSGNTEVAMKIIHELPQENFLHLIQQPSHGRQPLYEATHSPPLFVALLKQLEFLPPEQRATIIAESGYENTNLLNGAVASLDMVTALFNFIEENQQISLVLANSAHLDKPVHNALQLGKHDVARMLIKAVPPDQRHHLATQTNRHSRHSSLDTAIKNDVFDILALLLNLPENPSAHSIDLTKAHSQKQFDDWMLAAVSNSTPHIATKLLEFLPKDQQTNYILKSDQNGKCLLHLSSPMVFNMLLQFFPQDEREALRQKLELDELVDYGEFDEVIQLLDSLPSGQRTALIQRADSNGQTMLHRVLRRNPVHSKDSKLDAEFKMVQYLLRNQAHIDTNAVIFAMECRSHSVFRLLLDPKTTELMHADRVRRQRMRQDQEPSFIGSFDSRGWNALMHAIDRGDEEAARDLEWLGADRNSAIFLLNAYQMPLNDKLNKLLEIQRKVKDTKSNNPIVKNMLVIYQLSLEEGLETARKNSKPDEALISRLIRGLSMIDEMKTEEQE